MKNDVKPPRGARRCAPLMARLTVYQKPTCRTCRQVIKLLQSRGLSFESLNYYDKPFVLGQLRALLRKAQLSPQAVVRTTDPLYRTLRLAETPRSDEDWLTLLVAHPELIQRPIVETATRALLARPPERVLDLLF